MLHPRRALQIKAVPLELRHGLAPRLAAVAGAAVALPAGIMLGIALEQYRAERSGRRSDADVPPRATGRRRPRTEAEARPRGARRSVT